MRCSNRDDRFSCGALLHPSKTRGKCSRMKIQKARSDSPSRYSPWRLPSCPKDRLRHRAKVRRLSRARSESSRPGPTSLAERQRLRRALCVDRARTRSASRRYGDRRRDRRVWRGWPALVQLLAEPTSCRTVAAPGPRFTSPPSTRSVHRPSIFFQPEMPGLLARRSRRLTFCGRRRLVRRH
jgi:hypothetical protein